MAVRGAELLCASIPRLNASFTRDMIDRAIHEAVTKLGYSRASGDQVVAIREFVLGRDIFVMLPTGSGISLCYAALPYVFDSLSGENRASIMLVVSPLQSIMEDQVKKCAPQIRQEGMLCLFSIQLFPARLSTLHIYI